MARVFKEGEATQSAKSTFVKFGKIEETFKYTRDNLKEEYYQTQLVYFSLKISHPRIIEISCFKHFITIFINDKRACIISI